MTPLFLFLLPLVPALASPSQPQCTWGLPRHPLFIQQPPLCPSPYPTNTTPPIPPWTHHPYCIHPPDSPPWCVFTNAAIPHHNPHGLSIITTADLASTVFFNLISHRLDAA